MLSTLLTSTLLTHLIALAVGWAIRHYLGQAQGGGVVAWIARLATDVSSQMAQPTPAPLTLSDVEKAAVLAMRQHLLSGAAAGTTVAPTTVPASR